MPRGSPAPHAPNSSKIIALERNPCASVLFFFPQYFTTTTRNVSIKYFVVVKAKTKSSFVQDPEIHLDLAT